jgi:hypothetical protein
MSWTKTMRKSARSSIFLGRKPSIFCQKLREGLASALSTMTPQEIRTEQMRNNGGLSATSFSPRTLRFLSAFAPAASASFPVSSTLSTQAP